MPPAYEFNSTRQPIIGTPLHSVAGGKVFLVDGTMGNPILLNDDDAFKKEGPEGGTFYVLVAAEKGRTAQEVARALREQHRLSILPFIPSGERGAIDTDGDGWTDAQEAAYNSNPKNPQSRPPQKSPLFDLLIHPEESHHTLDKEVEKELKFRPDLQHLSALYGEKADYYMIACHLPNDREAIFGKDFRTVDGIERPARSGPTENINVRKFDLVQTTTDYQVEVLHRGGLALFDRQDLYGRPDFFHVVTLADIHYALRNDEYEKRAIELQDRTIVLKINNANANFVEAIIPWINEQFHQGKIDAVVTLGDNIDYDGLSLEASKRLTDSNNYYLARAIDQLEPPVFMTLGNHEFLPHETAAEITRSNFQLGRREIRKLQSSRYTGPKIPVFGPWIGYGAQLLDGSSAIVNDINSLIPYFDLFNPFTDNFFSLGRGEPDGKEAIAFLLNKGGADIAHWRQDDEKYETDFQGAWGFEHPFVHPRTTTNAIFDAAPDLLGLSIAARTWLHYQISQRDANITIFQHPPALNSIDHNEAFDPARKATPFIPVGRYEKLDENTTAHGAEENDMVAKSPHVRLTVGGHTHDDGNTYARWIDSDGQVRIVRGAFREVLGRIDPRDKKNLRCLWHPEEGLKGCKPEIQTLFQGLEGPIRNFQLTYQVGSAGVWKHPVFSVMTLTPEGDWANEQHHYVNKVLTPNAEPDGSTRYRIERKIQDQSELNERLIDDWAKIRKTDRRAWLDTQERLPKIEGRMKTDDFSFVPNLSSLNEYPRYDTSIRHTYTDDWKVTDHLGLRLVFDPFPLSRDQGRLQFAPEAVGLSLRYALSQDQIGTLLRGDLIEGVAAGGWRDGRGRFHLTAAIVAPPFHPLGWKVGEDWRVRALRTEIGLDKSFDHGGERGSTDLHLDMELFQLARHFESGLEWYCGLVRHGLFKGRLSAEGAWWAMCGADF